MKRQEEESNGIDDSLQPPDRISSVVTTDTSGPMLIEDDVDDNHDNNNNGISFSLEASSDDESANNNNNSHAESSGPMFITDDNDGVDDEEMQLQQQKQKPPSTTKATPGTVVQRSSNHPSQDDDVNNTAMMVDKKAKASVASPAEQSATKPGAVFFAQRTKRSNNKKKKGTTTKTLSSSPSPRTVDYDQIAINAENRKLNAYQRKQRRHDNKKNKNNNESKDDEDISNTPPPPTTTTTISLPDNDDDDEQVVVSPPPPTTTTTTTHQEEEIIGELVTDNDAMEASEHRRRVRREAELEAEQRIMNNAVYAETTTIVIDDDDNNHRKWYYIAITFALLLVIAVTVAVVVSTTTKGGGRSNGEEGVFYDNISCNSAKVLTEYYLTQEGGGGGGFSIEGNIQERQKTDNNDDDDELLDCQVSSDGGYGLWYKLEGNGRRLSASTCTGSSNLDSQSDTQVLIFSSFTTTTSSNDNNSNNNNDCDDGLLCIGGGDELCGSHSSVGWLAEEGQTYYILVRGFRPSSLGRFTLTIDTLNDNDTCDNADVINEDDSPVFGSTRNSTVFDSGDNNNSSSSSIDVCGETTVAVAPGSWYRIQGDGSLKCVYSVTDKGDLDFPLQLTLSSGGCFQPNCVAVVKGGENGGGDDLDRSRDVVWLAAEGIDYFLHVHGAEADTVGDFFLHLQSPPSNGICETATPIQQQANGQVLLSGTTIGSCRSISSNCTNVFSRNDSSGVWYKVTGTGNLVTATLNVQEGEEATTTNNRCGTYQVSVFAGTCSQLGCVDFVDDCTDPNGTKSQWFSELDVTYYLFVQFLEPSDFTLILEETILHQSDKCEDAVTTSIEEFHLGSTTGAAVTDLGTCGNSTQGPAAAVFFTVSGTGREMTASTCNEGTNFATAITILSGGCDMLECVDNVITGTCAGQRSIASWPSVAGEMYHIAVHSSDMQETGRFNLTIADGGFSVSNDFCTTAQELIVPTGDAVTTKVSSSTTSATVDDKGCTESSSSPGVWYSLTPEQNSNYTASLCKDTDFDTVLEIFSGSCSGGTLQCIASNDDYCGSQSALSWNAIQNETYYILVSGLKESDVGSFSLEILEGVKV